MLDRKIKPMRRRLLPVIVSLAMLTASCGGSSDTEANGSTNRVDALPPPTDEVVLTVRGEVTNPNVGIEVQADMAGIESLGLVTVTLFEPFISADVEFTGVPLNDMLAAFGVDNNAPLTWTALDDYQVHYTRSDVAPENALLATRQNGQPIAIEDGGPIRVVFADDSGPLGGDSNEWIWSLVALEVG